MKSICLAAVLAVALSLSPGLSQPAKGGKTSCTTAGANFDIQYISAPGAGLSSDGQDFYENGVGGVIGRINCNGQSLELSGDRHPTLTLGAALSGTNAPWGNDPAPVAFFNIPLGNFFNNAQPDPAPWDHTTYLKVTMASPNSGYFFNMENPGAEAPLNSPDRGVNTPLTTILVNVHHTPAGSGPETWVVTPILDSNGHAVGTLMANVKGGLRTVGQFDAPFSITVTRQ
ncbi:MAG TPA: hypothetical protein VGQ49_21840 [Bryobacteraceae bacterium]|jgi:hypothetical protein|nr:hypothetical protein [Bryobacteraceae bacterium]